MDSRDVPQAGASLLDVSIEASRPRRRALSCREIAFARAPLHPHGPREEVSGARAWQRRSVSVSSGEAAQFALASTPRGVAVVHRDRFDPATPGAAEATVARALAGLLRHVRLSAADSLRLSAGGAAPSGPISGVHRHAGGAGAESPIPRLAPACPSFVGPRRVASASGARRLRRRFRATERASRDAFRRMRSQALHLGSSRAIPVVHARSQRALSPTRAHRLVSPRGGRPRRLSRFPSGRSPSGERARRVASTSAYRSNHEHPSDRSILEPHDTRRPPLDERCWLVKHTPRRTPGPSRGARVKPRLTTRSQLRASLRCGGRSLSVRGPLALLERGSSSARLASPSTAEHPIRLAGRAPTPILANGCRRAVESCGPGSRRWRDHLHRP